MPIGRPAGSTTKSVVIGLGRAFMTLSASAASASGPIVEGDRVMISPTVRVEHILSHRPPQVSVGQDSDQLAAGIDRADAAEPLFRVS